MLHSCGSGWGEPGRCLGWRSGREIRAGARSAGCSSTPARSGGILAFWVRPRAELIKRPRGRGRRRSGGGDGRGFPLPSGPLSWAGAPTPAPAPPPHTELLSKKPEQSPKVAAETTLWHGRCPGRDQSVYHSRSASAHLCAPPPHSLASEPLPPGEHLLGTTEDTHNLLAITQHRQLAAATRPAGTPRGTSWFFTAERPPPPALTPHSRTVRAAGPSHTCPDARSHLSFLGPQNRLGARAGGSKVAIRVLGSL